MELSISRQPRFKGKREAFFICVFIANEESSTWSEGFIAFNPEFFRLELFGGYCLRKYDGEEINICNEEETQDFFAMKMQDYQDFEECTILRNRELEKMYCFDKKEQSVSIETQDVDEFAEYLKENYGIEKIGWKLIFFEKEKYRSSIEGFKDYPDCFSIKKIIVNEDNYYFLK